MGQIVGKVPSMDVRVLSMGLIDVRFPSMGNMDLFGTYLWVT